MTKLLQTRVNRMIGSNRFSGEELHLYLLLAAGTFFAGIMHLILFGIMLVYERWFLMATNIGSMFIYVVAMIILLKRRSYKLTGLIVSGEVLCYTLIASLYTSAGDYVLCYYFVLVFMQLIIPYGSIRLRGGVLFLIWLSLTASLLAGTYVEPFYANAAPQADLLLSIFNVNLAFLGTIAVIVASNIVRDTIARSNVIRMEEYKSQANTDVLTGLRNRRYAESFFSGLYEQRNRDRWCVAMLDIDDFKVINDTLGHPVGDEVLRVVAMILRNTLRKTDVIFRWGGEEFLILLDDTDLGTAKKLLEKIRERIADTAVEYDDGTVKLTVTIGVSQLDLQDIWTSISACDKKMYRGKERGKNRVIAEGSK